MLKQILFSIFLLFYQFTHLQTNSSHPNFILILADDQGWNGTSVKMINDNDLDISGSIDISNNLNLVGKLISNLNMNFNNITDVSDLSALTIGYDHNQRLRLRIKEQPRIDQEQPHCDE